MTGEFTPEDHRHMRLAVRLALLGRGRAHPNPLVGAVVVKDGRVVGCGSHVYAERDHAEVVALREAGDAARGATIYVTLEPCGHTGRTPPCVEAIHGAGIARVVYACGDPSPHASGRGPEVLEKLGIDVEAGCLEEEAEAGNRAFLHTLRAGRPLVVAKAAATPDGRLATTTGESKWLSGETSRRLYRRLRGEFDAIAVGGGTVRADDPSLSALDPPGAGPAAVILDGGLRTPLGAQLLRRAQAGVPVWFFTRRRSDSSRRAALERMGAEVLLVEGGPGGKGVDPAEVLSELGKRKVRSLLLEGGGEALSSFFDARLVDRLLLFQPPLLLGGSKAPQLWAGQGARTLREAASLQGLSRFPLGADEVWEGAVVWPEV